MKSSFTSYDFGPDLLPRLLHLLGIPGASIDHQGRLLSYSVLWSASSTVSAYVLPIHYVLDFLSIVSKAWTAIVLIMFTDNQKVPVGFCPLSCMTSSIGVESK